MRAIPSSRRSVPSHALRRLEPALALRPGVRVLDAGSGTGRHAIYMAAKGCMVDAVDSSRAACRLAEDRVARSGYLIGSVRVIEGVLQAWSLPDERYDVVIDSYVSCHLLSENERQSYLRGLLQCLRPGGRLFTASMGAGDAYYKSVSLAGEECEFIATDPLNSVTKLLQAPKTNLERNAEIASVIQSTVETFEDDVGGRLYRRQVVASVLQQAHSG